MVFQNGSHKTKFLEHFLETLRIMPNMTYTFIIFKVACYWLIPFFNEIGLQMTAVLMQYITVYIMLRYKNMTVCYFTYIVCFDSCKHRNLSCLKSDTIEWGIHPHTHLTLKLMKTFYSCSNYSEMSRKGSKVVVLGHLFSIFPNIS